MALPSDRTDDAMTSVATGREYAEVKRSMTVETRNPSAAPRPLAGATPIRRALHDHPATVLSLLAGALVILRLIGVTGYHLDVALALLGAAGPANVLIGTAITLIPYFLPSLAALALAVALFAPAFAGHRRAALAVAALVLVLAAEASPVFLLAFMVPISVVAAILQRRRPPATRADAPSDWEWVPMVVPAFGMLLVFNSPWLAPEVVGVEGNHVFGYVVSSDGEWTTILDDSDREVLIVDSSSVSSRTPCQLRPNVLTVTLPELLRPRVEVPLCPDH